MYVVYTYYICKIFIYIYIYVNQMSLNLVSLVWSGIAAYSLLSSCKASTQHPRPD